MPDSTVQLINSVDSLALELTVLEQKIDILNAELLFTNANLVELNSQFMISFQYLDLLLSTFSVENIVFGFTFAASLYFFGIYYSFVFSVIRSIFAR